MKNFAFTFLFLLSAINTKGQDSTYIWPTNSGNYLSSTFGETRSAHFHAGLDIKTWGREGYEVYASKDGFLSRLLITNKGYGKAIYLKHDDGYYTVYAHLQRFNKDFQVIADSIRLSDYSYTFEKFLEPETIRVKKGDVIGYTGSTGIGPPHLHFEIRNQFNQPINPLKSNLTVRDSIPPTFSSILIEPLSINTKIFGSVYPQKIKPIKIQNDTTFYDTVFVNGKIGLSPNVYDEATSVTNKYAVYKLSLIQKSDTLYSENLEQFDFDEADKMFLNRIPAPGSSRRSYHRVFIESGSNHPFLDMQNLNTQLLEGTYSIVAEDYYGNKSIAVIPVKQSNRKLTSLSEKLPFEYWTQDWISINDSTNTDLVNYNLGYVWDSTKNQRIVDLQSNSNRTISRITPNVNQKIVSPDYNLTTFIEADTFFDTVSILQDWTKIEDSVFIQIGVPEIPSRKNIYLQIQIATSGLDKSFLHLYSIDQNGEYNFQDSWFSGSTLHARISGLGNFTVLSDSVSPKIYFPKLTELGNGQLSYSIKTYDNLSGIDYTSAFFEINGLRGIPEYDYENDTFTFYHPDFKIINENVIRFEIKDKAGNLTSENFLLKN